MSYFSFVSSTRNDETQPNTKSKANINSESNTKVRTEESMGNTSVVKLKKKHQEELDRQKEKFEEMQQTYGAKVMELKRQLEEKNREIEEKNRELEEKNKKLHEFSEQVENLESELEEKRALETEEQTLQICENIVENKISQNSKPQDVISIEKNINDQKVCDFNSLDAQEIERVTGEFTDLLSEVQPDVQDVFKDLVCDCMGSIVATNTLKCFERSKLDERFFTNDDGSGATLKFRVRTAIAFRYLKQDTDGMAQEDARVCVVFKSMVEHMKPVEGGLSHNETLAVQEMDLY